LALGTVTQNSLLAQPNNACSGAIPVSCGQVVNSTTTGATVETVPACGGGGIASPSVWYSITGNGSVITASLCGSAYDTYIKVFSGSCASLVCTGFNDDSCGLQSQYSWSSVNGVTYYIMVSGFGSASGNFTLTMSCVTPSGNDACSGAISMTCGQTVNGSTAGATADGPPACGGGGASPSVWYVFTGDGSTVNASLCGSLYDTYITIYSGSCAGLTCIGFNDDSFAFCGGAQSYYTFNTVAGVNYYIMVSGFGSSSGSFTLNLSCFTPVGNDPCSGAIPVTCGSSVTGSTVGATFDTVPLCGGGNDAGVWYSLVGANQTITASLCGSAYDTFISVYSGSCAGLTCSAFNDNSCGTQSQVTWFAATGINYFIHVHGSFSSGAFTMNVSCAGIAPGIAPPGCPGIYLGPDISVPSCGSPCQNLTLNSTVFQTGLTTSYAVSSIPPSPPFPYNTGTGFSLGIDDVWTGVIDLPFNFCFFGNVYNKCMVGSNGLITFGINVNAQSIPTGYCPFPFTASCPSNTLPLNSIYGVYHDINPAVCGDARYTIFGSYPCRALVVSFDDVCHFSCTTIRSTHMIVIYETSNVIEVYVENKPTCPGWNSGNALIGIQNLAGTVGFVPPGRNTGPWSAAGEAWRFVPNGGSNVTVNWFQEGSFISSGPTANVCVSQPTTSFTAEAIYANCDGTQVVVTDDVVIACGTIMVPVEWQRFDAFRESSGVRCNWQTATEQQNDFFTVLRSSDMNTWESIGELDGAGNSVVLNSYTFFDPKPLSGTSYYRIKQTDFNGQTDYSEIRAVSFGSNEIVVFPNPASGAFSVQGFAQGDILKAWDTTGREIAISALPDGTFILVDCAPGTYFIQLSRLSGEAFSPARFVLLENAKSSD
jgi:hypothetical protein